MQDFCDSVKLFSYKMNWSRFKGNARVYLSSIYFIVIVIFHYAFYYFRDGHPISFDPITYLIRTYWNLRLIPHPPATTTTTTTDDTLCIPDRLDRPFRNSTGNWGPWLGRVSNFNQSINWHHHMKDHVDIDHLTKYDAFRVNRDQVMDLETWLKIHTNVSNFETESSKTI